MARLLHEIQENFLYAEVSVEHTLPETCKNKKLSLTQNMSFSTLLYTPGESYPTLYPSSFRKISETNTSAVETVIFASCV